MKKIINLQEKVFFKAGPISISSIGPNAVKNFKNACIIGGLTVVGAIAIKEGIQYYFYKKKQFDNKSKSTPNKDEAVLPVNDSHSPYEETLGEIINKPVSVESTKLLGDLIHIGETCVLYASTDSGKSILAIQIGIDIAGGYKSKLIPNSTANTPQDVYYYDSELRDADIQYRYGKAGKTLPNNFYRISDCHIKDLDALLEDMNNRVEKRKLDCTLIIDNITQFCGSMSPQTINNFYSNLRALKSIWKKRGQCVTLLLVAHTSKFCSPYKPVELKDISGCSNLCNFANVVIALGTTSQGKDKRILKSLKGKFSGKKEEVAIVKIVEEPYLHFEYDCSMSETDALSDRPKQRKSDSHLSHKSKVAPITIRQKKQMSDLPTQSKTKLTPEVEQEILTLRGKGYSVRKTADHMKLSKSTIDRVVQKHKDSRESGADIITDA